MDGDLFGPRIEGGATTFRLYAPGAGRAELLVQGRAPVAMTRIEGGFLVASVEGAGDGTRYRFRIGELTFPDLAARQQETGTDGWSIVRAPLAGGRQAGPTRPWHETFICEVHVGTATPEGTFAALGRRLEHFRDAGYTTLEIMPVNAFPGARNWGYDGTLVFAPAPAYGTPHELRALVERAHDLGLCMILDVVYNHFGPVDNFVRHYAPEWFDPSVDTPWGPAIDFDNPAVRQFYYQNARMWLAEYDFDGLRFDAIHEMKSDCRDRFLGELAAQCRREKPWAKLIIENMDNSFQWLERNARNEPMAFVAQWNDDMHHVLDFIITGDGRKTGYDQPGKDPFADLEKALADGFVHDPGENGESDGRTRGGPAAQLPPDSFITYVQNHDQIGNRSDALRLPQRTSPDRLDFAHFVKLLAPQIPLCFMGDEANLKSPFPFFVDLDEDAAQQKRDERNEQMRTVFNEPEFRDGDLPDPNHPATFEMAKMPWAALAEREHRDSLERFRTLGRYRREMVWPLAATPCRAARTARQGNALIVSWEFEAGVLSMALNPTAMPVDIGCVVTGPPVSTGRFEQHGEVLRLGAWSAVAWVDAA